MSKIKELAHLGQSVWYDYIRRSFLTSGEFQMLIDEGLRGVTSNPTIFEKAIAGSTDYDKDLKRLADASRSTKETYEALALKDISLAADLLRPIYDSTHGHDGYVSLEVSPTLARNTSSTVSEARRLFQALHRPNVMIKVPATPEGIPAITELIGSGVSVNITLLFDNDIYKEAAGAYLNGLETLALHGPTVRDGHTIDRIASVASFFVSRIDSAVDAALEKIGHREIQGKIAIANAKAAYIEFRKIFSSDRWESLAQKGARIQRLLWASTSTKNPHYPDTMYVDELIGPDTINTMPPATYKSFLDHGTAALTITQGTEEAIAMMRSLADLGIDLKAITRRVQDDGVSSFSRSFDSLMTSIEQKREHLLAGKKSSFVLLGHYQSEVDKRLKQLHDQKIMERIWMHDHTVWKDDPTEIRNRLGWLHSPEMMMDAIPQISAFADEVRRDGYTDALLLGMGGSSLAPELFRRTFGVKDGFLDLAVLDSTDPGTVLAYARSLDPSKTLFIVSTKSGSTVETISFMKYFYNYIQNTIEEKKTGKHFIAITDPGSSLQTIAGELGFRKVFLNDPNIGGRYSALSYFGLVPAALIGMDLRTLLERAHTMAVNCESCNCASDGDNSGALFGTILGLLANLGRDKLTLIASPSISHFCSWLEQLIAESTGKEGKGVLPVDGESLAEPDSYANDRLFVYFRLENENIFDEKMRNIANAGYPLVTLNLRELYDLGTEFFRWEMAVAVAGMYLGINPFDQPNVESAKILARKMVAHYQKNGKLPQPEPTFQESGIEVYAPFHSHSLHEALNNFFYKAERGKSYIAFQAYLRSTPETSAALQTLRSKIQIKYRMATTVGYGPRYLHSKGQLHKGDDGRGLFMQFTADMPEDAPIPDRAGEEDASISFGILKTAQALGDLQALSDANRTVIRFHLGKDIVLGLLTLAKIIE